jgi:hypothetical protein
VRLKTTAKGSKIKARIKAAADFELDAHVKLSVISGGSRWYVICSVCGGLWSGSERDWSTHRVRFSVVVDGDDYCEVGATNYFDADGSVTVRI